MKRIVKLVTVAFKTSTNWTHVASENFLLCNLKYTNCKKKYNF